MTWAPGDQKCPRALAIGLEPLHQTDHHWQLYRLTCEQYDDLRPRRRVHIGTCARRRSGGCRGSQCEHIHAPYMCARTRLGEVPSGSFGRRSRFPEPSPGCQAPF